MLTAAVLALVLRQHAPVYPDRAKFVNKLENLPERAPKAEVLKALGQPDRVERQSAIEEVWYYGTDGPKGAATLAKFEIYEGKLAYHPVSIPPPSPTVISETELRKGIHMILDNLPEQGVNPTAFTRYG